MKYYSPWPNSPSSTGEPRGTGGYDFFHNKRKPEEVNVCTKENPMPLGDAGRWQHTDAVEIDEDYGKGGGVADGDYIKYECPNCGKKFKVELPN